MTQVAVVGAGLAGLVCAGDLAAAGIECRVYEASDDVGGRVRTDRVDGFLLDRGFQILLTAYPQIATRLDLAALDLAYFDPGAVVRTDGAFHRVADPLRRPGALVDTVRAPVASLADMARLLRLVLDVRTTPVPELLRRPDVSTRQRLDRSGFSDRMIEAFWRPLFSGIQLDPDLEVSSRRFDVILRMLAVGGTAVPREGMGAIPAQLSRRLPPGTVRTGVPVERIDGRSLRLGDGSTIEADAVVVATDGPMAHRLLGDDVPDPGSSAAACCWFAAPEPPLTVRSIVLDGARSGPVANLAVMSEIAPSYAPDGSSLVVAAVPGPPALDRNLETAVLSQLTGWFGAVTSDWELVRTDVIPHGQPVQAPTFHPRRRVSLGDRRFVCGDHRDTASIQGAMFSGDRTAAAVLVELRG